MIYRGNLSICEVHEVVTLYSSLYDGFTLSQLQWCGPCTDPGYCINIKQDVIAHSNKVFSGLFVRHGVQ
jgi:hypothetical protein